jgi:predicted glycoside hydrolase/deacetylase ChbG (UPF0249 family)
MIILCADDYALTEGVSRAIGELAAARRLSATSAMVTSPHWPAMAPRLLAHRANLAVGLHLDLTLGPSAGPMPRLAPDGSFPGLRGLMVRAFAGRLHAGEIRAEIERQLDQFERILGFPPDHIDGHQHVQVLPGVRRALLDTVARRYPRHPPLIRNPADQPRSIATRRIAALKAALVAVLATGFSQAARRHGVPTNDSFAGFSEFDVRQPFVEELHTAFLLPGRRHIVMCHPGHPDAALAEVDPVVARRRMEYDALMRERGLPESIWRPSRGINGPAVVWPQL